MFKILLEGSTFENLEKEGLGINNHQTKNVLDALVLSKNFTPLITIYQSLSGCCLGVFAQDLDFRRIVHLETHQQEEYINDLQIGGFAETATKSIAVKYSQKYFGFSREAFVAFLLLVLQIYLFVLIKSSKEAIYRGATSKRVSPAKTSTFHPFQLCDIMIHSTVIHLTGRIVQWDQ